MGMFSSASTLTFKNTVSDKFGYVQALLNDVGNEGEGLEYDDWIKLVPILKFELPDEDQAFELFDAFSSQNDFYDEDFTYKKWHEAGLEADGRLTMGTLVHVVKEQLGDKFDSSNYSQFFGQEAVSKVEQFNKKLQKNKNKLPDHFLPEGIEDLKYPDNIEVSHEIALMTILEEDQTYGTATDPRQCKIVDPFAGDRLEQYITVNPVKGSRKQENVLTFKYAVLEFDTIHLDEQFSLLSSLELPYEALIFTGNKSIHAWIRIDAEDNIEYKKRTRLIAKMLSDFGYNKENGNGPDTAVLFDSSSLVRCPGTKRVDWAKKNDGSDGVMQKAIWAEESKGWDDWYKTVYPKYVDESSLEEVLEVIEDPQAFEVPPKDHNFVRTLAKVKKQFGDDYAEPLSNGLEQTDKDKIREALLEAIPEFFADWIKKNKKVTPLTESDLYHLFIEACWQGGSHYEGDIQEALYKACVNAQKFVRAMFQERKERSQNNVESLVNIDFEDSDPRLLKAIDDQIYKASQSEKPEEFENLSLSLDEVAYGLENRPAVLLDAEIHKYSNSIGKLLRKEVDRIPHLAYGSMYVYLNNVNFFDPEDAKLKPIEVRTFPSLITPMIGCIKKSQKGLFNLVPLDNDSTSKLLASSSFKKNLNLVKMLSEVPVFKEIENGAELIMEYDDEKACLVTKEVKGYGFMDLEEAKATLVDLFVDFDFVHAGDKSRAIAALLTPALAHSGILTNDGDTAPPRPMFYIDADSQGAGKNVLADFLTLPYVDNAARIAQDDSSVGSIDDKLGFAISTGENIILLDNLKPTRKQPELSSSFIESLITADAKMSHRSPGQANVILETDGVCLYVTTNGMPISKDLAERSFYLSIRKKPLDYSFRRYPRGHNNWIRSNRPKIMSAIYTILREYVLRGKPTKKLDTKHRFVIVTEALNYIVTEIMELPDISGGTNSLSRINIGPSLEIVRAICFAVDKTGNLGNDLKNLDIFEILQSENKEDILGLPYSEELYSDEDNTKFTNDAKRSIGQKISRSMSNPNLLGKVNSKKEDSSCTVEEYSITRSFCPQTKSAIYKVTKDGTNET